MHIAQIAPLTEAVPPKLYGGTERVVANLCDALVQLGHEVTLFAAADAQTDAKLIPVRDRSIRLDPAPLKSDIAAHFSMLHEVRRRAWQFDILHFHIDLLHFSSFRQLAGKCLTTLHGRMDLVEAQAALRAFPEMRLVSVSDTQRHPVASANFAGTVHHGLPADLIPFSPGGGDYLAFIGRISPEKRPDRAVEIARRTGMRLRIAAKVDHVDRAYFEQWIAPLFDDPLVEHVGEIGDAEKPGFLGAARALLFPIDWPEPFGLSMIEAMAAGTPVIAWRHGAAPEIVEQGRGGFLVDSLDEAAHAVAMAATLPRQGARAAFEERFTAARMVGDYLKLYEAMRVAAPAARAVPLIA